MYNHNLIEKKWQKIWEENNVYKFRDRNNPKFYVLDMFPYPSGKGLHVGHPKGYTATDVISRFKRLNNFDVLHPIGWDAFGLPAEQYAIDTNNHPAAFTENNINIFRSQLKRCGFDYDYNKEVNTSDKKYYKWTQWIFTKLFEQGLAEIQEIDVNWCENLKTTLSNEEVILNDKGIRVSERGSHPVIRKPMKQWVLKITQYADRLLDDLELLDWPESLKSLQRNWIGKTIGHKLNFSTTNNLQIEVFTSRIDTIFGMTALILNPKHNIIPQILDASKKNEYEKFLIKVNSNTSLDLKINKEKNGLFTGSFVIHPLTKKHIPIWIADYILDDVGTGAIMLVPSHDERDAEFAKKYQLPFIKVIDENMKYINSEFINGLNIEDSISELEEKLSAEKSVNYKLKDWVFSRQRYWGEPFPIIFDENNIAHIITDLPLILPECSDFKPNDDGQSPLAKIESFINVIIDNKKFKLDSNTMPQWAGSCWYYLAYLLKQEDGSYIDLNSETALEIFKRWLPVDIYIGGQEHAVLHLLYARFWHKFLYDIGIVPTLEPFYKIINQGLILGEDGTKMSKSQGNVINPDDILLSHGADSLRMYECFMGPLTSAFAWKKTGLDGVHKWLDRVYRFYYDFEKKIINENESNDDIRYEYHNFIKSFEHNINCQQFNLAISDMMIFLNALYKNNEFAIQYLETFIIALSCFAPYMAEEIWHEVLKHDSYVCWQSWPKYEEKYLVKNIVQIPFQINGKIKKILSINKDLSDDEIIGIIESDSDIKKLLDQKIIKKKIIVKNKIANYLV